MDMIDLIIIGEIARLAMDDSSMRDRIADHLDLSDEELDRVYSILLELSE